jgi:CIC family chloride channel protein
LTLPQWWYDELRSIASRSRYAVVFAALTGVLTGLVMAGFEFVVVRIMLERLLDAPVWVMALAPAIGLVLCALVLATVGKGASPALADEYIRAFHEPDTRFALRSVIARFVAALATLGSGVAMGLEGPATYVGSAIGANLHRWLPPRLRGQARSLLIAGTAAGVAAVFKAPATGAVFALEVPYRDNLARDSLLPSLVAAATGYLTFVAFAGTEPLLPVQGVNGFSFVDLVGAAAIGVLGGLGARGFARLTRLAKHTHVEVNAVAAAITGGAVLATLLLIGRWATGETVTLGPGYEVIRWALRPDLALWVLALVLLLRCGATLTAVGAGAAGGLFIPLVVAGALLGRLVAGGLGADDTSLFVIVGISSFLGAGYRVPLAAVMFVAETTGRPFFVVPALIAAVAAELVVGDGSVSSLQRSPTFTGVQ